MIVSNVAMSAAAAAAAQTSALYLYNVQLSNRALRCSEVSVALASAVYCLKRSALRVILDFRLLLIRSYAASKVSLDCHVYLLFQHFPSAVCSFSYSLIAFHATLMIVFLLLSRRF